MQRHLGNLLQQLTFIRIVVIVGWIRGAIVVWSGGGVVNVVVVLLLRVRIVLGCVGVVLRETRRNRRR